MGRHHVLYILVNVLLFLCLIKGGKKSVYGRNGTERRISLLALNLTRRSTYAVLRVSRFTNRKMHQSKRSGL